ncbi:MAG: universal stress protein [Flavobacteriaceae bacterium]|nr:universal stress protein [Bacteroidia bacterium]NNL15219.1 universal stress protein [Flavobacteriaceae bacterium]
MKNILVGIDFHDQTEELISKSVEIADQLKAKLWLLHVASPNPDFVGYEAGPEFIRDKRADILWSEHKKISDYTKGIKEKGVDAEGLLIQGATIETILTESIKLDIELIIAGYHEHNFFYNAFFGNTSVQIIKESKIPVLVFPLY